MKQEESYGRTREARVRRRRSAITLGLTVLFLFFAAWYALSYMRADEAARATTPTTPPPIACTTSPHDVAVNVYNATSRNGLAASVAKQLKERGFTVKTVANDPKKVKITGRGQLRYGSSGKQAAELVGLHAGPLESVMDARTRVTVDVVLGPKFQRLATESTLPTC